MSVTSPLSAVIEGALAGALASMAQGVFFRLTRRWAPANQRSLDALEPDVTVFQPTASVATRHTDALAPRGTPPSRQSPTLNVVHGAGWGAAYGIAAASSLRPRTFLGGVAFGLGVWGLGSALFYPALTLHSRLLPSRAIHHVRSLAAHAVFGAAVYGAFAALDRQRRPALSTLGAIWLLRRLPEPVRVRAYPLTRRGIELGLHARDVVRAFA